jgi:hypothetical protein
MGRKILGILICMLFILTMVSTVGAKQERQVFKNCYIEAKGELAPGIHNFWKLVFLKPYNDDRVSVLYWVMQWMEPNVTVTIYDEKNSQVLWNDGNQEGLWAIKLLVYNGLYSWSTVDGHSEINLQGTVKAIITYTGD